MYKSYYFGLRLIYIAVEIQKFELCSIKMPYSGRRYKDLFYSANNFKEWAYVIKDKYGVNKFKHIKNIFRKLVLSTSEP